MIRQQAPSAQTRGAPLPGKLSGSGGDGRGFEEVMKQTNVPGGEAAGAQAFAIKSHGASSVFPLQQEEHLWEEWWFVTQRRWRICRTKVETQARAM